MSNQGRLSIQSILKSRQKDDFIGRNDEIDAFRENIYADDSHRRFVINVFGQGGIGKSSLLGRFRNMVEHTGGISTYVNEEEIGVPEVMAHVGLQLKAHGYVLKMFEDRYEEYRKLRHELESDPEMPQGLSAAVSRALVTTGVRLGRRIPGAGIAFDFVNEADLADHADELATWLNKKLKSKDNVQLIREPLEVLTPLFVSDLTKVLDQCPVTCMFDTYEYTQSYLDEWLRSLLLGSYGLLPSNVTFVIAGRYALNGNSWIDLKPIVFTFPLERFTENEAREYLSRKGIVDERIVSMILALADGLPLLLATLASNGPRSSEESGDPTDTAVERFLKWIPGNELRAVALNAALSRSLNKDVLAAICGPTGCDERFEWLRTMPFVLARRDNWVYHDVVRNQMVKYKRRQSPQEVSQIHHQLATYYEDQLGTVDFNTDVGRRSAGWRAASLEVLYHRLSQMPFKYLSGALSGFVRAFEFRPAFARLWATAIKQAGVESDTSELQQWGSELIAGTQAFEERRYDGALEMFSKLLKRGTLDEASRPRALFHRAMLYKRLNRLGEALEDLRVATTMMPRRARYWAQQGLLLVELGQFEDAAQSLTKAIALEPASKGVPILHAERGIAYHWLRQLERAISDFDIALSHEESGWLLAYRADAYRRLGDLESAIRDSDRAVQLQPAAHWINERRGILLADLQRYDEAIQVFTAAETVQPTCMVPVVNRAFAYWKLKAYAEALGDLNHAISIESDDPNLYLRRVQVYEDLGDYGEAINDLNQALHYSETDASQHKLWKCLGRVLAKQGKNAEAIDALRKALGLEAACSESWYWLAQLISRDASNRNIPSRLLAEENLLVDRKSNAAAVAVCRANALASLGLAAEAQQVLHETHHDEQMSARWLIMRAKVSLRLKLYSKVADDLTRAWMLDRKAVESSSLDVGLVLSYASRYEQATERFKEILRHQPMDVPTQYNLAITIARWKGVDCARVEIENMYSTLQSSLQGGNREDTTLYGLAGLEALQGNRDLALQYLKEALSKSKFAVEWAQHDIAWSDFRSDEAFISEIEAASERWLSQESSSETRIEDVEHDAE